MLGDISEGTKAPAHKRYRWHTVFLIVIIAIGTYTVVSQRSSFRGAWQVLEHAQASWLLFSLAILLSTYLLAALIYQTIAQVPLRFSRTLLMQVAALFTNRLLPAGIGAMGLNFAYLRRSNHTRAQATAVITVDTLLGVIGNILLLAIILVVTHNSLPHRDFGHALPIIVIGVIVTLALVAVVAIKLPLGRKLLGKLRTLLQILINYRQRPYRLAEALLYSMLLTIGNTMLLVTCARAVGLDVSFDQALLIMSLGVVGASVTPTPGGVGGAEAALVAGLTLYGFSGPQALAIALLYRIFTYWLGFVIGGGAFLLVRKRQYI